MSKTFSITETARRFGIPASTLRYYDKEGLLPGVERTQGGMRLFTGQTLEALHVIDCLKQSGLSIQEIRQYFELVRLGSDTVAERRQLFEGRRRAVQEQIRTLQETLKILNFKCWFYETAEKLGSEEAALNLSLDEMPPQMRLVKEKIGRLPADPEKEAGGDAVKPDAGSACIRF